MWQQRRVHLAIAIDLHHNVHAIGDSFFIGCDDGTTDAAILWVVQHSHSSILIVLLDEASAAIGAGIIDCVDRLDLGADGGNHAQYMLGHFVAGNGHCNAHLGFLQ
ncbi:hypothetical protein D3C86_1697840 [compost metagenome]